MTEPFPFNPLDPEVRRNPYALYERGRRELPAFVHEGLPLRLVSIFRYTDVQAVLRDTSLYSNDFASAQVLPPEVEALGELAPPSMIGTDPPVHTRLRSLVNKAFTPRIVSRLEPRLREVADQLMDDALDVSITLAIKVKTKAFNRGILIGLIKTSILIKKRFRQSEKDLGNRPHSNAPLNG